VTRDLLDGFGSFVGALRLSTYRSILVPPLTLMCYASLLALALALLQVVAAANVTLSERDSRITYSPAVQWHAAQNSDGSNYLDGSVMHSFDPQTTATIEFQGPPALSF
jgi:hypothetical protein